MSNNPPPDTIGYDVVFSSFEEIVDELHLPLEDPSECKSIALNYCQGGILPLRRYRAIPLTRDIIINAINILRGMGVNSYDPRRRSIDSLLDTYFRLLEVCFSESSMPSANLNFIRNCMAPLLEQGSVLPCWERENMIVLLEFTRDDPTFDDFIIRCENGLEPDMPEGIILDRAFILRWIFNNFPYISKIITHKTDGAHRDFAYDALFTGTFGSFEGHIKERLTRRFLEQPNPIDCDIFVEYTIPTEFT